MAVGAAVPSSAVFVTATVPAMRLPVFGMAACASPGTPRKNSAAGLF
jgi:hypothetical protein